MRVLHLAAGNRWTGAAAPAFAEVEALRAAGIDAHYAYVGGYKLEAKLGVHDFAHPIIGKKQNPRSFVRAVEVIERLIDHHQFDVVHAHLTYDHWLARWATRGRNVRLARTFHARRTLRADPFTRHLIARTDALFVVNDTLAEARALRGRRVIVTPPPLDLRQFWPEGPDVRSLYGIPPRAPVVMAIGKITSDRGFQQVIEAFAIAGRVIPAAVLLIVGHGEDRPRLERLVRSLGLVERVIWAGYHEDDLAEHYRAASVLLFTAQGSDEGHRAVLEAMGCGVIPVTYPLPGMAALLGGLANRLMAPGPNPEALAVKLEEMLQADPTQIAAETYERAVTFAYPAAARRLIAGYAVSTDFAMAGGGDHNR